LGQGRAGVRGFLSEVVEWVDFNKMWLLADVWSIVFQTDKMENQGAEYYLHARELIPEYR